MLQLYADSMRYQVNNCTIELVKGDITQQPDMQAVVNAANAQLLPGGGVAGAIHRAAGPGLADECKPKAPIQPGEAVITSAHHLPNDYVIHCLGPVYGENRPSDTLLEDCYTNALQLAEDNTIQSIAFPAISTGAFNYPVDDAAEIALNTVRTQTINLNSVTHIRFVLFSQQLYNTHAEIFEMLFN